MSVSTASKWLPRHASLTKPHMCDKCRKAAEAAAVPTAVVAVARRVADTIVPLTRNLSEELREAAENSETPRSDFKLRRPAEPTETSTHMKQLSASERVPVVLAKETWRKPGQSKPVAGIAAAVKQVRDFTLRRPPAASGTSAVPVPDLSALASAETVPLTRNLSEEMRTGGKTAGGRK